MADTLLRIENLKKSFGKTNVLNGVSIDVGEGEFVTLLGSSGCGKTTTLRIVAGLTAPDSGKVYLSGKDITDINPEKRNVNTVFQSYALFPHMNVEKNISYGLRIKGVKRSVWKSEVQRLLELVQLSGYEKRMPSELSGGQRQRVAIARAVIVKPGLLLLDEPLGALDLKLRRQMQTELKDIQKALGISFIYVTHDQEEALNMSDRIAVMKDGLIEQIGTPEEIYESPKTEYVARFIGGAELFSGVLSKNSIALSCGTARVDQAALPAGARALVCVHSERIVFSEKPVPGFDIPAVIKEHRYAGSMIKTSLVTKKDGRAISAVNVSLMSSLPAPGTEVYIYWNEGHAGLIPEAAK